MKTAEELEEIREACASCAHTNWDGGVTLTQDENGCLTFVLWNEDKEQEATLVASPYGEALGGQELWRFAVDGDALHDRSPIGNLVPKMIVGLLGL